MGPTDVTLSIVRASRRGARPAVVIGIVLLTALGWAVTVFEARTMGQMAEMSGAQGMPGMPATSASGLLFLSVWTAMMVAMMFPSVAPTAVLFTTVGHTHRQAGRRVAPTWAFLVGYLTIWSLVGLGVYLLSLMVPAVSMAAPGLRASSPILGGLILVLAGVYQWSPLKKSCLAHCRSPLAFLQREWRGGAVGGFRSGLAHGVHCVGCCAGLMLVLFVVGLMNLGWMVLLAAVFFVEKVVPHGPLAGKVAGVALVVSGVAMLSVPWVGRFPT